MTTCLFLFLIQLDMLHICFRTTNPSRHCFFLCWPVSLLQSHQLPSLNRSQLRRKWTASCCSAIWPPPTASPRRATGWRTGRKSLRHEAKTRMPSTGGEANASIANIWFCSLLQVNLRFFSDPQDQPSKRRRRWRVHVCLHLWHGPSC